MTKRRLQTKWRFVGVKDLTAAIAYWAVKLSPYDCPANLVKVIRALTPHATALVITKPKHKRLGFALLPEKRIKKIVEALVLGTPGIRCWNRCRRGKTPDFAVTSAFSKKPHPDRSFIDLHALVLEIMHDFRKEWADEDRDAQRAPSSVKYKMSTK
jgi:hypothetical protein